MNVERAPLQQLAAPAPPTPTPPAPHMQPMPPVPSPRASRGGLAVALALAALGMLYGPTLWSMADVWLRSATFAHGIVIAPISGWLIWRQRQQLQQLPVRPATLALPLMPALGAVWLLATVAHVQVLQQFCVVLMAITAVITILGGQLARALSFPLGYLLLAVPFGEVLIAPLIDITASFCVLILQALAIPVFRENNYLTLPTGTWSVVEACSGLRYLIASLAMGTLYAYLTYRSTWRRLAFVAVSLLVPVIANGMRAAMIIMLGHWSDMTVALGVDHLIYGWVFFGLVTLLLFWIGGHWRQQPAPWPPIVAPVTFAPPSTVRLAAVTVAALALAAIWPAIALLAADRDAAPAVPHRALRLAAPPAPWRESAMTATDWHALHQGQPSRWSANYVDAGSGRTVSLQLTWYRHQRRHDELLAPVERVMVPGLPRWHATPIGQRQIVVDGRRLEIHQTIEQSSSVKLLVWRWYRQQDVDTSSAVLLKLLTAKNKLLGRSDSAAEIVVACAYDDDPAPAGRAMAALLQAMLPAIGQGLDDVAR
jgi:exosortase A